MQDAVRAKVAEIGGKYGLRKAGAVTYPTAAQESGWMPRPFPALYCGADMQAFREWLPAKSFEGGASLGGDIRVPLLGNLTERHRFSAGPVVVFSWSPQPGWPVVSVSGNCREVLGYLITGADVVTPAPHQASPVSASTSAGCPDRDPHCPRSHLRRCPD